MKRAGYLVIILSLCIVVISFILSDGYKERLGFLGSLKSMEIVIRQGDPPRPTVPAAAPAPAPDPTPSKFTPVLQKKTEAEQRWVPLEELERSQLERNDYESKIAIPLRWALVFESIIFFIGLAMVVCDRKRYE